jgi:hypothetical protein
LIIIDAPEELHLVDEASDNVDRLAAETLKGPAVDLANSLSAEQRRVAEEG